MKAMVKTISSMAKRGLALLLMLTAVLLPVLGYITLPAEAAESVLELDGTRLNGATVLDDSNKYLPTASYVVAHDGGYNTAGVTPSYALKKNGVGTPYASFFIDALGEGGSVLKGADSKHGYAAYGFVAGSGEETENGKSSVAVKLKYNYSSLNGLQGADGKTWSISDDTYTGKINGISPVGLVGKGAVIVQKFVPSEEKAYPSSASDWKRLNEFSGKETDGFHTVNFFSEYSPSDHGTPFTVYTPAGEDMAKGIYIRFTVAYELVNTVKTTFLGIPTGEKKTYRDVVEETVFYLCNTSGEVVFENLYFRNDSGEAESTEDGGGTTSANKKEGPISEGQGAIDGFKVDKRGWNYDIVYRRDGSDNLNPCADGQVFLEPGRYDFIIRTAIGVERTKTVYVHEKTNRKNVEVYFGDNLVSGDSVRIFAPAERYPVYLKGTVTLRTQNENVGSVKHAPLVGRVYRLSGDWDSAERDGMGLPTETLIAEKTADNHNWSVSGLDAGNYEAVFYNNEEYFEGTATGDTYRFVWRFTVSENGQAPTVNEELLYQNLGFSDYNSIFFAVRLPAKGKGDVLVPFTDESEAYVFACDFLVSRVAELEDGYLFDGVTYPTEEELLVVLREAARGLIERRHYDANDVSTYVTLNENVIFPVLGDSPTEEEMREYNEFIGILDREYPCDIIVFISEDSREDHAIGDPFLNDRNHAYIDENGNTVKESRPVYFISVADYESSSVTLYHDESGKCYGIPYGVGVQSFLESRYAPSGRYRVVETNPSGETEYYAIYVRRGDLLSALTLERVYNNNSVTQTLTRLNNGIRLRANNFRIVGITNALDPYGFVKIVKHGGETRVYGIGECDSIPDIDEEGSYEIVLSDRLGNTASFFVDIYEAKKNYSFTLTDGDTTVFTSKAYGGKRFTLPVPEPVSEELEFFGWADGEGNIYNGEYLFNSPENVILTAVWHYSSVKVEVYDGELAVTYTGKVGDTVALPKLRRDGYELYGYRYVNGEGAVRFYRGQVSSLPNVPSMRVDAVWKRVENVDAVESGEGDSVKITLIDGGIYTVIDGEKGGSRELPTPEARDGMKFLGWLYEYRLAGMIFGDRFSYGDVARVGLADENSVKLVAVWTALSDGELEAIASGGTGGGVTASTVGGGSSAVLGGIIGGFLAAVLLAVLAVLYREKAAAVFSAIGSWFRRLPSKAKRFGARISDSLGSGNVCRRVLVPLVCLLLSVVTLYTASYETVIFAADAVSDAIDENNEEKAAEREREERAEQLREAFEGVGSSLGSDGELDESEEFLYSNIIVDLYAMGYTDVFTAYVLVGADTPETEDDRRIDGIGYTAYADAYEIDGGYEFGAGFVSLSSENALTVEEAKRGVKVFVSEEEADYYEYTEFRLTANRIWGPLHYVAYGKYVTYQVLNHSVQYTVADDSGEYNDALGDVYSYDAGEFCHYVDYGEPISLDAYGITSDMDYDNVLQVYREAMDTQLQNSVDITVEKADFISYQAINDYIAHYQDETFLGVDADTLLYYEANIADTQYYIIYGDGTVGVLELPPDPEEKASLWERIGMAVATVGVAVLGVVCCAIPGVGPILGGAMISAALDVFMQVTVMGAAPEKINWASVAVSAVTGALTGGIGSVGQAAAKSAVKAVSSKVAKFFIGLGVETVAGMLGGAVTSITTSLINGQEVNFEDCLKSMALGAATGAIIFAGGQALSAIAGKTGLKSLSELVGSPAGLILGGAMSGFISYCTAIIVTGAEFDLSAMLLSIGMGAATGAIMVIGGKIVSTVKTAQQKRLDKDDTARLKQRISKDLPSGEDGSKWYFVDKKGNRIYKQDLLNDPYQEFYMVSATDADMKMAVVNGYPQQSAIADADVYIEGGITTKRTGKGGNFRKFDKALADKWSMDHDLIPDDVKTYLRDVKHIDDFDYITALDIHDMRSSKTGLGYTWHESEDMHTAYLVKTDIHKTIKHSGGVERLQYLLQTAQQKKLEKLKMFNAIKNGS